MFGTVPVFSVPVRILYRTYRDARYRYWCWTKITEVAGTGMKVCTGTGGTGIYVVPKLPKCPVQVFMAYPSYRSAQYRYWCRTDLTEVSGTGIDVVPNLPMCPVPVSMSYRYYRSVRYRYWCRSELTEVSGTGNIPPVCLGAYRTEHTLDFFTAISSVLSTEDITAPINSREQ